MTNTFYQLSQTAQRIYEARHAERKVEIAAHYLATLKSDQSIKIAIQFLAEGAFPATSEKRITIGSRTYSTCAARFCEINYEKVFKPSKKALADAPEAIEKLMQNVEAARQKRSPANMRLAVIQHIYQELSSVTTRTDKQELLQTTWKKMHPVEIKYFIKIMIRGSLGIGTTAENMTTAIAQAFEKDPEKVRYIHMITGNTGQTAVLAKNDRLNEAKFRLFHPIPFMKASSGKFHQLEHFRWQQYAVEEDFDGLRTQVHISEDNIHIYSANQGEVTRLFPEVLTYFRKRKLPDLLLDGVLCVFKGNQLLPVQLLYQRMESKDAFADLSKEYPAIFITFDILFIGNTPLFNKTYTERRRRLKHLSEKHQLAIANSFAISSNSELQNRLDRSFAHGSNGLIIKKKNSRYEYGSYSKLWLNLQSQNDTLDTVVMYAHRNPQNDTFEAFTLGVRVTEDDRYKEEFIPIGKTPNELTGEPLTEITERIQDLTDERYGPTLRLIPKIAVALEFDTIHKNKRTKANYRLQKPHICSIRWNEGPEEIDTLQHVEHLYGQIMNQAPLKQNKDPSFYTGASAQD